MKVCVAPTHLVWNETLGGHAWVFLNWMLGLQANGCEIVIYDKLRWAEDPDRLLGHLRGFRSRLLGLGLRASITLLRSAEQQRRLEAAGADLAPLTVSFESVCEDAELFLNFRYSVPQEVVNRFRRAAMVDIDPGLLQMWIAQGSLVPARHDINFTIGETVGEPGSKVPDCGLEWIYTPPPVHLPSWPVLGDGDHAEAAYTTVTNWWGEYEVIGGQLVNNEKRAEFLEYLDLPSRTRAPLELAIYHQPGHDSEMPRLREHGWRARAAHEVSDTPQEYRKYIQRSRGEFSCAKRSCMQFENAWISDRTICYLASGKPAIVQHTGSSRFLPDADGLFRFRDIDEAARYLDMAEQDPARHRQAARALVEAHFDANKVAGSVLARAMEVEPRQRSFDAPRR